MNLRNMWTIVFAFVLACGGDTGSGPVDGGTSDAGVDVVEDVGDTGADVSDAGNADATDAVDAEPDATPQLAPDPSVTVPDTLAAQLQAALDEGRAAAQVPGAVWAVWIEGVGYWAGASGMADVASETPMAPDDRGRIGSLSKSFAASVVLQLADEGTLGLDDTLDRWLPEFDGAAGITVNQLLTHTSGIYNYTNDLGFWGERAQPHTIDDVLAIAEAHGPDFAPGTSWNYSNTGYYILGEIIEQETGGPWGAALHQRVLGPLGLTTIAAPSIDDLEDDLARGYDEDGDDVTFGIDPSSAAAAGELVAGVDDLVLWLAAVTQGDVYDPEHIRYLSEEAPFVDASIPEAGRYAFGFIFSETAGFGGPLFTHTGGIDGFLSQFGVMPESGIVFAGFVNSDATSEAFGVNDITVGLIQTALDW